MRFWPLIEGVRCPGTERWGEHRYALELSVPIDGNSRIDKEWVVCVPARRAKRKIAPEDLVHIECQEGRLTATMVPRVQLHRDGELVFANVHNVVWRPPPPNFGMSNPGCAIASTPANLRRDTARRS